MEFTVGQIAEVLRGAVEGDATQRIDRLAKIEEAQAGALSFLANSKYEHYLYTTGASAVIVAHSLVLRQPVAAALIRVDDPYSSFTTLLEFYQQASRTGRRGVEEPSFVGANSEIGENHYRGAFSYIGEGCRIGRDVLIFPQAYIGDRCQIGDGTIIYAGAKIYADTVIGARCTIHAGAVLGSDGFGFAPQADGSYRTIPQIGNVVLEDNVSVGANTTIDCATMGSTVIREGSKIDNLVQLAHNVEIGRHTVVAAQTGVSGSTKIGDFCVLAGQAGIAGHLTLANRTTVTAQSGVGKSIKTEGVFLQGSPAFSLRDSLRANAIFRHLPDLERRLDALEHQNTQPENS
ncbi:MULTISPECIES: UDP-3-O-(3-hydroxymyristoyl)glucosamine N-acyltransferase [Hymenobacter]|uniref:UDP-3-O-acylglucosamine N-acyltransferase n=1 Tax=Hymenobacter jejuensis TaxID=2502781 RepID=A0A5B8A4R3_9BACT|nr:MULTISPECIES: UDP-3-O-(3-hydroxymyristoyl)glucosamine N-acyltransferase [Hymenobacter]MBC6990189.1 UDP-3-O-(3-hydroxymyristoyl)glucosamine N-acyltransferase [Hymenobacter sp. BT491]QDA62207.1 UDP-3-O-(3-hydroxymyristoyl)glucosamine N-acyltransferase [Hymenobacter jejuensis]